MVMWKRKKESNVVALIEDHLNKVEESVQSMISGVEEYLNGNIDSAEAYASKTHDAESKADEIRREIADLLHSGAFLPIFREDVMLLVGMVDKVAGCAQSCCKFIVNQRPEIPTDLSEDFLKITRSSASVLPPLQEGVKSISEDFSATRPKIAEVDRIEREVDNQQGHLSRRIFSTDMDLAHKMHLKQLVDLIADISDIAQDASEILNTLVAKKQV